MKHITRILALLLALLMLPLSGLAAEKSTPIQTLGAELVQAQAAFTKASGTLSEMDALVAGLEKEYARDEDDARLQDKLIDAMILQEEALEAFAEANAALILLREEQSALAEKADCEDLVVEYEGRFADLTVTVSVDEDMVIHALTAEVDGSERDQLVGRNDYLYGFIGKDIPLTIGNAKKDDVAPLQEAQQTSRDLVDALNSLVCAGEDDSDAQAAGPITEPQAIADYIFRHGRLPDNFITKKEAQNLGWDSSENYVSDVAPGKSIGGDRFGNYEGLLPSKKGRTWYEADCYYTGGRRNAHRILFSSDGLVYYTDDHYESFTQMFPSDQ